MNTTTTIRTMTFNVRGSDSTSTEDGLNSWSARASLNVDTIKHYEPDTIGFQEIQNGNWKTYLDQLPEYDHLKGPKYVNEEPFDYPSIFWKTSRFHLLDSGGFWLSETPDIFSTGWDAKYVRSAAWIVLKCNNTGLVFTHWNTHLDNKGESSRIQGAKLILQYIELLGFNHIPVLITADFNSKPNSEVHRMFLENNFMDTFLAAGNHDNSLSDTFHGFEGANYRSGPLIDKYGTDRTKTATRMDWVLIRKGIPKTEITSCSILRDHQGIIYPSDHYPVITELYFTS